MTLTIKTERLLLRPLDAGDVETVHEYAGDAENTRYMMYLPNGNIEDTRTFLERVTAEWEKDCPGFYEFAVVLEGRQIGAVSVALGEDEAELGWILNRKYWNRGYITEAAMAVKDFAVNTLGQKRLCACCDARNLRSVRVMEKLGFTQESEETRTYRDERGQARQYRYVWLAE